MAMNKDEINSEIMESRFSTEGYCQHAVDDVHHVGDLQCGKLPAVLKLETDSVAIKDAAMSQQCHSTNVSESSPLNPTTVTNNCCYRLTAVFFSFVKWFITLYFPSYTFLKFFAHAIIPALANNLIPLFFIGNIPNESALALAGQFTFISVIIEVIQEGIVNSLFHYVGRNYTTNREKSLQGLKLCVAILVIFGSIFTALMVFLNGQFVNLIDTPETIAEATRRFLLTSSFSYPFFLVDAALSSFLLITTSSYLVAAQVSSVVISFLCNFLVFGGQGFSLHWNVEQLGYYKIIQTSLSCVNNFIFCLIIEKRGPLELIFKIPLTHNLRANFKDLFHISWGNFGDSAIRNFFYFMVTLKFINNLGETEIAAWNLMNTIVWGLLLIPSFAVANYVKVKIGHHGYKTVIRKVAIKCLKCLTAWLVLMSLLSYFLWPYLAKFFGKSNEDAQILSMKMLNEMGWIFIVFSYNNAMDSLFIGIGKTQYVFYQSSLTNLIVYFIPWLLYLFHVIQPSYWLVIGLYIAGMIIDFSFTAFFSFQVWATIPD